MGKMSLPLLEKLKRNGCVNDFYTRVGNSCQNLISLFRQVNLGSAGKKPGTWFSYMSGGTEGILCLIFRVLRRECRKGEMGNPRAWQLAAARTRDFLPEELCRMPNNS
jgi:hypothetical protein